MVTEVVKELEAAKAKVIELEDTLQREVYSKLAGLPAEYGFDNLASFIKALKVAAGARKSRASKKVKAVKAPKSGKRSKRTRITEEVKTQVKSLIQDGKTGAAIAKSLGISLPSVQNIKKELGLVKTRK